MTYVSQDVNCNSTTNYLCKQEDYWISNILAKVKYELKPTDHEPVIINLFYSHTIWAKPTSVKKRIFA